jgi:hypothetical protein
MQLLLILVGEVLDFASVMILDRCSIELCNCAGFATLLLLWFWVGEVFNFPIVLVLGRQEIVICNCCGFW